MFVGGINRVRISDCSITGNEEYGVCNPLGGTTIDARYNWWGHATGPSGVGPGLGDAVSEYVLYDPWRPGGRAIAISDRAFPTQWNNARKIVRDECYPSYKVFYTNGMGVYVIMSNRPETGEWLDPIEIWPVDMLHHSTDPAAAIEKPDPDQWRPSRIHLVWAEHVPDAAAPGEIYYTYSDNGGFNWSGPFNLSQSATPSEHPSIAVDGNGQAHVVWEEWETFTPDVFYSDNSTGEWTPPVNVSMTSSASIFPTIEGNYRYAYPLEDPTTPDDRVHIAWTEFEPHPAGLNTPWIAYRSFDPLFGWIPALDDWPEDPTQGMGGACASLVAFPSALEMGRVPAIAWHWPYDSAEPPTVQSNIYFNDKVTGLWGAPRIVDTPMPVETYSRNVSLAIQPGEVAATLWAAWENHNPAAGLSEIVSAYSPDLGQTWIPYLDLSQTPATRSLHPSLAYIKTVTFQGLYDICWTEQPEIGPPGYAEVRYIGATSLLDWIAADVPDTTAGNPVGGAGLERLSLSCHPSLASDLVTFSIAAHGPEAIEVGIYDLAGRRVRVLEDAADRAGVLELLWDGRDSARRLVPAGVYYARARSGGLEAGARVVWMR
jgi:hypothetical protein